MKKDGISRQQGPYLDEALLIYSASDIYPMHMPGHKRRTGSLPDPYSIDITETEGMDNLHHADGILMEAQERANDLYGADETFYLVGGSSAGILAALHTVAAMQAHAGKNKILFARNSHKSAYHGLYLSRTEPVYLYPQQLPESRMDAETGSVTGPVSPATVAAALDHEEGIAAVFVTSPTYDGVVSDIASITGIAHAHGIPVIVDEAHGAHFGMHPDLPPGSVSLGADLVIHSLHKTLPSLTQTALLHVNGELVDRTLLRRFLQIYQTTSPSYVLMASMDQCVRIMQSQGEALLSALLARLNRLDETVSRLHFIRRIRTGDPTKLLFTDSSGRLSGTELCDILRRNYHLEPEMDNLSYVLCLTSAGDDEEGMVRLMKALEETDRSLTEQVERAERTDGRKKAAAMQAGGQNPRILLPLHIAWDSPAQPVPLEESAGRICGEFVYLYPPGIPLLVPGEEISASVLQGLLYCRDHGCVLQGMRDDSMKMLQVLS